MRIQHNIMAMNAYRNYTNNTSAVAKNLEKLSSGYRINRAGDDAAGLAISEKMRAQITGLSAAQKNVKDGISLVKTAEGATQEIHDMLNRMVYLAEQSANGTYQDEVDREAITNEFNQLKSEIDRIADSSNFNGIKLLDGSLAAKAVDSAASADAAESANMQDIVVSTTDTTTDTVVKSIAAKGPSFTAAVVGGGQFAATAYDAFKISYTNDKGEAKELYLTEGAVATLAGAANKAGTELADALNAGDLTVSTLGGGTKEDLEEFTKLFDIKATADEKGVIFSTKDASSTAKVTGLDYGKATTAATSAKEAFDNLAAVSGKSEAAAGPQAEVQIAGATADSSNIKVGSDVFTSKETGEDARAKDLLNQLKEAGYDASLKDGTTDTIVIKNLQQAQKDVQIENTTSDPWTVTGSVSTKGTAKFTMVVGDQTEHEFTVNYINQNGENATKKVTYKSAGTSAGDNAAALKTAIEGDADLNELFKVEVTAGSDAVTITSKGSGTASGYVTGVSSEGINVATGEVTITKPQDTGKTLTSVANAAGTAAKDIRNKDKVVIDGKTYQFMSDVGAEGDEGAIKVAIGDTAKESWQNLQKALAKNGVEAEVFQDKNMYGTNNAGYGLRFVDKATAKTEEKAGGLTLQIGATSDDFNQLTVSVGDMHVKALGIADLNLGTQKGAQEAVSKIKDAINYVSQERGTLGATQNRLEHTANNLSTMKENIQDAESSIRDTDIADEMMAYTKNNILVQSAQAMLAQANQVPQGVLQLLG